MLGCVSRQALDKPQKTLYHCLWLNNSAQACQLAIETESKAEVYLGGSYTTIVVMVICPKISPNTSKSQPTRRNRRTPCQTNHLTHPINQ